MSIHVPAHIIFVNFLTALLITQLSETHFKKNGAFNLD